MHTDQTNGKLTPDTPRHGAAVKAPVRKIFAMWAIKSPLGVLLIETASRRQSEAWCMFDGYLGFRPRAAKQKGFRAVRVVIHEPHYMRGESVDKLNHALAMAAAIIEAGEKDRRSLLVRIAENERRISQLIPSL